MWALETLPLAYNPILSRHENVSESEVVGKVKREEHSQPGPWKLVQFTSITFRESKEAINRYSSVLKMFVSFGAPGRRSR